MMHWLARGDDTFSLAGPSDKRDKGHPARFTGRQGPQLHVAGKASLSLTPLDRNAGSFIDGWIKDALRIPGWPSEETPDVVASGAL